MSHDMNEVVHSCLLRVAMHLTDFLMRRLTNAA